jgi:formylmethanofuran dehydrogenase subunit D
MNIKLLSALLVVSLPTWCPAASSLTVKATNKLQMPRASQTIELSTKDLAPLAAKNLETIHVKDSAGEEILCQAVDTDFDEVHKRDTLIFQADFAPGESKTFTLSVGKKHSYKKDDFKAYGRLNQERFDDYAWENDLIAHRTYGTGLITWKGEPLTSSSIDIWSKNTSKLVINDWYMLDDYHNDHGDGCDDYSAGATRGDGGIGLWVDNKLMAPINFSASRTLANGPIRVLFELDYPALDANGAKLTETLRVSLDAGSQLDHYVAAFKGGSGALTSAIGLKKTSGAQIDFDDKGGTLTSWEPMEKNMGMQGLGIIVEPRSVVKQAEDAHNNFVIAKTDANGSISYWTGFAWDRAGKIASRDAWKKYVSDFAQCVASPIEVTVSGQ